MDSLQEDAEAVAAVRRGDTERYRELVERYKKLVFAVAWSRLGDVTLAEEAAQEAFIRGYRRLWLLTDGRKFRGWIAAIARNGAINLGIRRRRELNKRELWALQNVPGTDSLAEDSDDNLAPDSLGKALADLSPAHRECLVLFYIEGKAGDEAANVLGISETAFRVRLHRARTALRERVELSLEESLRTLKPASRISSSVMAIILAPSTTKSAGAGIGALVGILAKVFPVAWFFPLLSTVMVLPIPFVAWFATRSELKNFREPAGFRSRMYRDTMRWQPLWIVVLAALLWFFPFWIRTAIQLWGHQTVRFFYLFLAAFFLLIFLVWARRFSIIQNRFFAMEVVSAGLFAAGCLAIGLRIIPVSMIFLFISVQAFLASYGFGKRPNRMDYNLFLRSTEQLFERTSPGPTIAGIDEPLSKEDLLAFGRFLGCRWLAIDFRWMNESLVLRVPPMKPSRWSFMQFYSSWPQASRIVLKENGKVSSELSERDHRALDGFQPGKRFIKLELETEVNLALETAWAFLRSRDLKRAVRAIGETPDNDVFVLPPARSGLGRWRSRGAFIIAALAAPTLILSTCQPAWISNLRPVKATELEIRTALAQYVSSQSQSNSLSKGLSYAISTEIVLPSTDLLTPETLDSIRREIFKMCGLTTKSTLQAKCYAVSGGWMVWQGLDAGWFSLEDLGLNRVIISEFFHSPGHQFNFSLSRHSCNGPAGTYTVEQFTGMLLARLRGLRNLDLLDLVDRRSMIQQLRSLQVLSGEPSGGRLPLSNWRDVRGLFYLPGWPVIQDTFFNLSALEILGGLDLIDREACVKSILRLHRGKGYFAPPDTDEPWMLQISGNAHDTLCAFESLRILGALDRIKDLELWRFRPQNSSKPIGNSRQITWDEIEAWVCQQRLDRYLQQRKLHPTRPGQSLLEL